MTGNWTFGHVAAKYAMEVAIEKARTQNVAVAGIVQANHIGRLGEYVELAAANGMIGMVWAGGYGAEEPAAVPFGGRELALHTNPLSMGFPSDDGAPVMFDFATTTWSGSKARLAQERHEAMPPGSARGPGRQSDDRPPMICSLAVDTSRSAGTRGMP